MINNTNIFGGCHVIEVPDFFTVGRSLFERLFSLPWRPHKLTKQVANPLALGTDFLQVENALYCSPTSKRRLVEAIEGGYLEETEAIMVEYDSAMWTGRFN